MDQRVQYLACFHLPNSAEEESGEAMVGMMEGKVMEGKKGVEQNIKGENERQVRRKEVKVKEWAQNEIKGYKWKV